MTVGAIKAVAGRGRWLAVACGALAFGLFLLAAPAEAQNRRQIVFHNDCRRPVRVLVHITDNPGVYNTYAWWDFAPGERSYLQWQRVTLGQLDDHALYIYAEATDGSRVVWSGNAGTANWRGVQYALQQARVGVVDGDLVVRLTC